MQSEGKRSGSRKPSRLLVIVVILAVLAVALGIVGVFATGGSIIGGLPDVESKEPVISPLTGQEYTEELPARPLVVSIDNV